MTRRYFRNGFLRYIESQNWKLSSNELQLQTLNSQGTKSKQKIITRGAVELRYFPSMGAQKRLIEHKNHIFKNSIIDKKNLEAELCRKNSNR